MNHWQDWVRRRRMSAPSWQILYQISSVGCDEPLAGLGEKEKDVCCQLAEMGFPPKRLASVARYVT